MLISQDEKARLRGNASAAGDELSLTLTLETLPQMAGNRSSVLKCALESGGEATLPVTASAFQLWLDHQTGCDETLEDYCTILKVILRSFMCRLCLGVAVVIVSACAEALQCADRII